MQGSNFVHNTNSKLIIKGYPSQSTCMYVGHTNVLMSWQMSWVFLLTPVTFNFICMKYVGDKLASNYVCSKQDMQEL